MARGPWSIVLLLLLASALLLHVFVTPVVSNNFEETQVPKGEVVKTEPEKFEEAYVKPASGGGNIRNFSEEFEEASDTEVWYSVVKAGEPIQVDVEIKNDGPAALKVAYSRATLHLLHDHRHIIQNFTVQESSIVVSAKSKETVQYFFSINKFLQPGSYDFVGHVVYDLDGTVYRNVFHNGTIDVVEGGSFVKGETVFLSSLGLGLLGLLGMWSYSKLQEFIKKQRRSIKKVETGTRTSSDATTDEWLQGTSITQKLSRNISQQRKSHKKKPSS